MKPRKASDKTVQELVLLVTQLVGKNPKKAALIVDQWINKDAKKQGKKIA